jgi:hypothetical protein
MDLYLGCQCAFTSKVPHHVLCTPQPEMPRIGGRVAPDVGAVDVETPLARRIHDNSSLQRSVD